jgi:hypothetical protein
LKSFIAKVDIELSELPADVRDETRMIVTFIQSSEIDLRSRGIDESQAAEIRADGGFCRGLGIAGDVRV